MVLRCICAGWRRTGGGGLIGGVLVVAATFGYGPTPAAGQEAGPPGHRTEVGDDEAGSAGPPSTPPVRSNRDIEVELLATPSVAPGNVARLLFAVVNYEEGPLRVRLHLEAGTGWTVLDPAFEEREHEVEGGGEEIEGELLVQASPGAGIGEVHVLRLIVEVVGEAGIVESSAQVRVVERGGLRPGQAGLGGTVQVVTRGIDPGGGASGAVDLAAELAGKIDPGTDVRLDFRRGPPLTQPPVLHDQVTRDRIAFDVRRPGWSVSGGNGLFSSGGALVGPFVRSQGATLRRTEGSFTGDLTVGRPLSYANEASGTFLRGGTAWKTGSGRLGVAFTALERPGDLHGPSGSLLGGGLEAELRRGDTHRTLLRIGGLRASADSGFATSGPSTELQYGLTAGPGTVSLRGRSVPASVPGMVIPGDEASADVGVRLPGGLRASGRTYRSSTALAGGGRGWRGSGAQAGLHFSSRDGYRAEARVERRRSQGIVSVVHHSIALSTGASAGPLHLDGLAEVGRRESENVIVPTGTLRTALRWLGPTGWVSGSVTYQENGFSEPRLRLDVGTSLRLPRFEMDGGAWVTRGPSYGGDPGVWSNLVMPFPLEFSLIVGGEYVLGRRPYMRYLDSETGVSLSPDIAGDPGRPPGTGVLVPVPAGPYRVTLGLRRRVVVPLPSYGG